MTAPVFTLYFLVLALNPDGSPLLFGMGANGPLAFHSFAACEVERAEAAKRKYPGAYCMQGLSTKGEAP